MPGEEPRHNNPPAARAEKEDKKTARVPGESAYPWGPKSRQHTLLAKVARNAKITRVALSLSGDYRPDPSGVLAAV